MKLICKVQSGLCNRILPFITSLNLSIEINYEYYLYWDENCGDSLYKYQGKKTKYNDMFENLSNVFYIEKDEFNKYLNSNKNKLIINYKDNFNFNRKELLQYDLIILNNYCHLIFLQEDQNNFKSFSSNFNFNLEWHCKISNLFNNLHLNNNINKIVKQYNTQNMIGLHIRHRANNWMNEIKYNKYDYLKKIIINIYSEIKKNKNIKFFVSTSNKDFLIKLKSIFNDKIIYYKNRLGNPNIDHFYKNDQEKDVCTLYKNINGLIDLYLLSKCKVIYCEKSSSYSVCAHLMNKENKLIIVK